MNNLNFKTSHTEYSTASPEFSADLSAVLTGNFELADISAYFYTFMI